MTEGQHLFDNLEQVQLGATDWLWAYGHERPNMALGGIAPMQKLRTHYTKNGRDYPDLPPEQKLQKKSRPLSV